MQIFQYNLEIIGDQILRLSHHKILAVKEQNGKLVLYAYHDPKKFGENEVNIYIFSIGHFLPPDIDDKDKYTYIDSVVIGHFVWHVYAQNKWQKENCNA